MRTLTGYDGEAGEGCGGWAACVRSCPTTTDALPHWEHQESREQGKTSICPSSLRGARLSQSEKVSDSLQRRPTGATRRRSVWCWATGPRALVTCCREG